MSDGCACIQMTGRAGLVGLPGGAGRLHPPVTSSPNLVIAGHTVGNAWHNVADDDHNRHSQIASHLPSYAVHDIYHTSADYRCLASTF